MSSLTAFVRRPTRVPARAAAPFLAASTLTVLTIGLRPRGPLAIAATLLAAAAVGLWASRPRWLSRRGRQGIAAFAMWIGYAGVVTSAVALVIGKGTIASNAYVLPLVLTSLIVALTATRARLANSAAAAAAGLLVLTLVTTAVALLGAASEAVAVGAIAGLTVVWLYDGGAARIRHTPRKHLTERPLDDANGLAAALRPRRGRPVTRTMLRDADGPSAVLLSGRAGLVVVPASTVKLSTNRDRAMPKALARATSTAAIVSRVTRLPVAVACPTAGAVGVRVATAEVVFPSAARWRLRRRTPVTVAVPLLTGPVAGLVETMSAQAGSVTRHAARGAIARCVAAGIA